MMIVRLNRFDSDQYGCLGELTNPPGHRCYVLERPTTGLHPRIPSGTYQLGLKKIGSSKFDATARKFMGGTHRGMIEVLDVPGRTEILIHWGNTVKDSEGCLLVGDSYNKSSVGSSEVGKPPNPALTFWVNNSRETYRKIYPSIADAILGASGASLTIIESFIVTPQPPLVA